MEYRPPVAGNRSSTFTNQSHRHALAPPPSRPNRAARSLSRLDARRTARTLRHHQARARALATRPAAPTSRLDGLRGWLHSLLATMRAHAGARRLGLPAALLRKPSSRRHAHGPRRRVNRPRRLAASAGWFAFGTR
ncbi:hypothetical protein [Burkholderia glumae]|uniref:hypothetical protein n=2 Tax=Burkholderia glumae TaxID=337 RepID=UPI0020B1A8A7|nr:hypothetical protein [Burkholderia glumae]